MAAPHVTTYYVVVVTDHSAILTGHTDTIDLTIPTSIIAFEYGLTDSYGSDTWWEVTSPGRIHRHEIFGLRPDTVYHFRMISYAGGVYFFGNDKAFRTASIPIPTPPPIPPTPSGFMSVFIFVCNVIGSWFASISYTVQNWIWPFNYIAPLFLNISMNFYDFATAFYNFQIWLLGIIDILDDWLSWEVIYSLILQWFPNLNTIIAWFSDWWNSVRSVVNEWWLTAQGEVLVWYSSLYNWTVTQINTLSETVTTLGSDIQSWTITQINNVTNSFTQLISNVEYWTTLQINNLSSAFTTLISNAEYWTVTQINTLRDSITNLIDENFLWNFISNWWNSRLLDIQGLFTSWAEDITLLSAGWQDIAESATEFFNDPLGWIYDRLEEFFERFW